jgi:hypothetical protein
MSVVWSELGAAGQRRAEEHFVAAGLAGSIREAAGTGRAPARPVFADLYAWVTDPDHHLDPAQQAMVESDPTLRRTVALLVGRVGRLRAVAAAAASSGGLDERRGPGFSVRLTASRADPAQTYVTIEIDPGVLDAGEAPSLLLVMRGGAPIGKLALPEAADGMIQLLENTGGDAVRGLRAPDTELVLV